MDPGMNDALRAATQIAIQPLVSYAAASENINVLLHNNQLPDRIFVEKRWLNIHVWKIYWT